MGLLNGALMQSRSTKQLLLYLPTLLGVFTSPDCSSCIAASTPAKRRG